VLLIRYFSYTQTVVGKAKEATTTKNRAVLFKQGNNSTKPKE